MQIHRLGDDVSVLNDHLEVPGIGFLPVNAFVLHAADPVVVDTGLCLPGRGFIEA
nr:MBL fold metallo-hydrolase [Actinomycetota bacterium]